MPYIGITDFTDYAQVERMLAVFNEHRTTDSRRLHVGVMMSYKTLNGLPTKWAAVFPPNESVASIFASSDTMNCLHYADPDQQDLSNSLEKAIGFGGSGMNAVQLDMDWPDPSAIRHALNTTGKKLEVILQLSKGSFMRMNWNPSLVANQLQKYAGIVQHVLLDHSGGRGVTLNVLELLPFARAISRRHPKLGLGVAGGLGPGKVHLVEPMLKGFPDISIDAQSRLRPSYSARDPINWDMAEGYLIEALRVLK